MANNLVRKELALGIILLFIGSSVVSGFHTNSTNNPTPLSLGNTLYVGGNGTGNYTRIQDAIDNTSNGDTVFAYAGTYNENLNVTTSINLQGEERNTTVIDQSGCGPVIIVYADFVNISGFTINNEGEDYKYGTGIELWSNHTSIFLNKLHSSKSDCIDLHHSFCSEIFNNIVSTNYNSGIALHFSKNCTIIRNHVIKSDNYAGIRLLNSTNNTISQNIISPDPGFQHIGIGIYLHFSSFNIISSNIINRCKIGVEFSHSYSNVISDSELFSCTITGIDLFYSTNNTISRIIFSNQSRQCIRIFHSDYNYISTCYMCNNTDFENTINNYGLLIQVSNNNTILNCIICNNMYGLMLEASNNNNISNNIIENNSKRQHKGFGLYASASYSNIIYHNTFNNNPIHAFFVHLNRYKNKWIGNYWGRLKMLPKLVIGGRGITIGNFTIPLPIFPLCEIDWHPAKQPYDIP